MSLLHLQHKHGSIVKNAIIITLFIQLKQNAAMCNLIQKRLLKYNVERDTLMRISHLDKEYVINIIDAK